MSAKKGSPIFLLVLAGVTVLLLVLIGILTNPSLTHYIQGDGFKFEMEKETAKGLHFSSAHFDPIHRLGFLTAGSDRATGRDGRKAMTSLDAHGVTATFNPAGVFLRRWSIDELHVDRAEIGIQTYEPVAEPNPARPWFSVFLPNRVYLRHVWSNHADITWKLRGQRSGIFDTKLNITPHGRDFNYAATGGTLRTPLSPDLPVSNVQLLITKTLFQLYRMDLGRDHSGTIHAEGRANTRGQRDVDFKFSWKELPLADWLPNRLSESCKGDANGELHWTGPDYKLASAILEGKGQVARAKIVNLRFLDAIAAVSKHPDLRALDLDDCRARFQWKRTGIEIHDLALEQRKKFRIVGDVTVENGSIVGKLDLGVAENYLDWLPHPEEVFPRQSGGFLWTTVHLGGTLDAPVQDLSPRLLGALEKSPEALLSAGLRALGVWLRGQ